MTNRTFRSILFLMTTLTFYCLPSSMWADPASPSTKPAIPKVGDKAVDFSLNGLDGKSSTLTELTNHGPIVLIVLRGWPGYQCPLCTRQVGDFVAHAKDLEAAGATVVMVYPGPADQLKTHAEEFFKDMSLSDHFRVLVDPDFKFTEAYGLRWHAPRETAYPSTFVIDSHNVVRFAKVSKTHGDRASAADAITALSAAK